MGLYHPLANLFEGESRSALIDKLGDPLKELNSLIKWEEYRPLLEEYFPTVKSEKGGRPRMDPLMMFKVLILEKLYDLSDRTMEYQIADRLSFQRFLGIQSTEGIPDEKTIWLFREQIKDYGLIDRLFDDFVHRLKSNSLIVNQGKIANSVPDSQVLEDVLSETDRGQKLYADNAIRPALRKATQPRR